MHNIPFVKLEVSDEHLEQFFHHTLHLIQYKQQRIPINKQCTELEKNHESPTIPHYIRQL
jgi:hypothetical protein